jgi:eukaryotic-like serine/threonine-protein kinase
VSDLRELLQSSLGAGYRLSRELGGGGMAKVYVADDPATARRVVVKLLAPDLAAGVNVERFKREIQVAISLHHPRIVPVLSAGQSGDELLYYTMPFIQGETLRALIEREQQLPLERALAIARDVAEALDYAHGNNIVHRDIKPENILIEGETGRAVVTDFGIARAIEQAADLTTVTSTGLTLGTPTYMSPEQAGAEKHLDGRSDIYSLGCVLYEMLAGVPPFSGPTARAIIARHITEAPPPIRVVRPDLPGGVELLLQKMLAKVPAARQRDARRLLHDLEHYDTIEWRPLESRRRTWWIAAGVLAAAAAALWLLPRSQPRSRQSRHDATRVAVLPFDGPRTDAELNDISRAISGDLVSALRTADIRVISEAAISHFPPDATPFDVAKAVDAGTLVYGRLEPLGSGDSVRLRVRLVDDSALERESFDIYSRRATTLALRDSVVRRVADRLFTRLGRDVQLERWRTRTRSDEAWLLRGKAQNLIEQGRSADYLSAHDEARTDYIKADSLLLRASRADPRWAEPWIGLATVSWNRSRASDVKSRRSFLDSALARVANALAREPESATALALRGEIRFDEWQHFGGSASMRDSAALDIRRALDADTTLAAAWSTYSSILQSLGDETGAVAAARRAIGADPYRRDVVPSMNRLIIADLTLEHYDSARTLCDDGVARFPQDPVMRTCVLNVLGYAGKGPDDIARAWAALALEERDGVFEHVSGIWPPGRFFLAAILARSGLKDSARAVIAATRAALRNGGAPAAGALYEAYAWTSLGERDTALTLLDTVTAHAQPADRAAIGRLPWFKSLHGDARFERLLNRP